MSDCDTMNCSSLSLLKLMSIESVTPSNHLILGRSLPLSPSIFPSIRVFSNELVLHIRWLKYWSFSFTISPSNEYSGSFPLGLTGLILQSKGLSRVFSSTAIRKHQFFSTQPFYGPTLTTVHYCWKNNSFDHMDLCWQSNVSAF